MTKHVSRRQLIDEIQGVGLGRQFTISEIARRLGVEDYPVRGAFAWCLAAKIVIPAGCVYRRTPKGKSYRVVTYQWTGKTRAGRETAPPSAKIEAWLRGA